jgi:hypothetical protein
MLSSEEIFGGLFKLVVAVIIFVFLAAGALGVFLGNTIWGNSEFIESKTKIEPAIKLTTDGKKIDTLYVYKIK